jgi:hypothetical protein
VRKAYVDLTRNDLERILRSLADGTWNQKPSTYHFSEKVSANERDNIRADAKKQQGDVMNIFAAEDLLSGITIMKTVLDESNPSATIRFVRNGGYIYGYAKEKYQDDNAD